MGEENTVEVWSGCFAPFRLITLDDEKWAVPLAEINARTVDTTRLFRMTLNFDVGIAPFSLVVLFDGTLVLPASAAMTKKRALTVFNGHLMEMLLGGLVVEEVAPDDVGPGSMNQWGYHRHHYPRGRYSQLSHSLRTLSAGPNEIISLLHPTVLTATRYRETQASGAALARHLPGNLSTVILPSCTAYTNEKWERALILAWTSVELVVEQMWNRKVVAGGAVKGISPKRRRAFLSDTRTWGASTRIELLWQMGHITDEVYALADAARAARNAFVHSAAECSPMAARSAVEASLHLIKSVASEFNLTFGAAALMKSLDESTSEFASPRTDENGRLLVQPTVWREMDPAPGFKDWGDRPFQKLPAIRFKPVEP